MPLVYDELRRRARRYLRRERREHTLEPTALVHEAYMRLVDQREADWRNRTQFYAVAAVVMRRVLVDHARSHRAEKRGGSLFRVPLVRMCRTREELKEQVRRTVMHKIAHFFGISDDRLRELGAY